MTAVGFLSLQFIMDARVKPGHDSECVARGGTSPGMTNERQGAPRSIRSFPRPGLRSLRELRRVRVRRSAEREGGKRESRTTAAAPKLLLWVPAFAGMSGRWCGCPTPPRHDLVGQVA